jgi:hypothetical protein
MAMMTNTDLHQALSGMAPKTKAARVRLVLPLIEQKIAEGVRIADMLAALHDAGIAISLATLKSYLYRYRKKQAAQAPSAGRAGLASASGDPAPAAAAPAATLSLQALDRLMKPDPARQADELAHYERLARQQSRKGPIR